MSRVQKRSCYTCLKAHRIKLLKKKELVNLYPWTCKHFLSAYYVFIFIFSIVVRPWLLLTHVNMSHNKIATLDHSLKLLPALEQVRYSITSRCIYCGEHEWRMRLARCLSPLSFEVKPSRTSPVLIVKLGTYVSRVVDLLRALKDFSPPGSPVFLHP